MARKRRKSKNPFKMWGSYIGAIIGWLSLSILPIEYFNFFFLTIWQQLFRLPSVSWGAIPPAIITGFLVGWGIHSLIRRLKK